MQTREQPRITVSTIADAVAVASFAGAGWILAELAGVLIVVGVTAGLISWSNR